MRTEESAVVFVVYAGDVDRQIEQELRSIAARLPIADKLLIVEEPGEQVLSGMNDEGAAVLNSVLPLTCVTNRRTTGIAGSLNTAALHVLDQGAEPEECVLVFVDGRFEWSLTNLERCSRLIQDHEMVITLVGSWSGTWVRLSAFLMAGMFDEDDDGAVLASLAHRMTALDARIAILETAGLELDDGLDSANQVNRTRGRDKALETTAVADAPTPSIQKIGELKSKRPLSLYVGLISGDGDALSPLLDDLESLRNQPFLDDLVVSILQNGGPNRALKGVVDRVRRKGLRCALITEEHQQRDSQAGAFGAQRHRSPGQVGIAQARTMLQRYLAQLMLEDGDAFGWILDDDMRLDARVTEFLPWLPSFRDAGVDALIGAYEGSSPNPPTNGLRVQLVDLWRNLEWLESFDPSTPLPDRSWHNRTLRLKYPDYYYDLSRKHTGHLETVHWIVPSFEGETVGQARGRMVQGALGLLSGAPLTRPVFVEMPQDPISAAQESVNRGGNTFIINPRAISETPNAVVQIGGREARRSDMVWAIIARYYRGRVIKRVSFPVQHIGRPSNEPKLNLEKVIGEIVGSAFYGAFTDFLAGQRSHDLEFSSRELEQICSGVAGHVHRRLCALALSFYRIQGLAIALKKHSRHGELDALASYLQSWFTPDSLTSIEAGVRAARREDFEEFLNSLRQVADDYCASNADVGYIRDQIGESFI